MKSTGLRMPKGKAKVARNAIKHGLLSELEVLPGLERQEDWEAHCAQMVADLVAEAGARAARRPPRSVARLVPK